MSRPNAGLAIYCFGVESWSDKSTLTSHWAGVLLEMLPCPACLVYVGSSPVNLAPCFRSTVKASVKMIFCMHFDLMDRLWCEVLALAFIDLAQTF